MSRLMPCVALVLLTIQVGCSDSSSSEKSTEGPSAALSSGAGADAADPPAGHAAEDSTESAPARGLVANSPGATDGYVLFSPLLSDISYLVDNEGRAVHLWKTPYSPGGAQYLLANGHLLRPGRDPDAVSFRAGGAGGYVQEIDWEGNVVWEWRLADEKRILHHDIEPMPNGHILALAWETKSHEEAAAIGRKAESIGEDGLWPDWVVEVEPIRPRGARIVWEWHAWDHLIQDEDPTLPNYGEAADHPRRIDINGEISVAPIDREQLAQLQAIGYVPDDADADDDESRRDFLHINALDYNPELDQIALSVPTYGEIWIVDHGTTTAEAARSIGGRAGLGGDLLYRWGNPSMYGRGRTAAKRLFYQHDVRWIPAGWKGGGRLMVFNNGADRGHGSYSSVDEIVPPIDPGGGYRLVDGAAFGPTELAASYMDRAKFFSAFISGAHRLRNGNTMICQGVSGRLFEITPDGRVVWDYLVPYGGSVRNRDGSPPQPGLDDSPHAVFRATRVAADHPGLSGRTLTPLDPQPPIHTKSTRPASEVDTQGSEPAG